MMIFTGEYLYTLFRDNQPTPRRGDHWKLLGLKEKYDWISLSEKLTTAQTATRREIER